MTDGLNPVELQYCVWCASDVVAELRQGEIITGLIRYDYNSENGEIAPTDIPTAIVLTQDCDLLQDFEKRNGFGNGTIDHVLLMAGYSADEIKSFMSLSSKEMKVVQQNLNPRFHFLEACPPSHEAQALGFAGLVIDFRSVVALPISEIYYQCASTRARRAALEVPYREHFQARAAQYLSRIALPVPHSI